MRKSIARALHEELETILSNAEYAARGDHFIVYADVNAVEHGGDRATGETTSYDDDEHALWRALRSPAHGLQDLMAAAYAVPPMTYAPKNKPTSRIDLLFASGAIAANAHAATASALGSLSATHLPLACSFRDDGLAGVPQDLHSEGALDSAVAIMATVGGRKEAERSTTGKKRSTNRKSKAAYAKRTASSWRQEKALGSPTSTTRPKGSTLRSSQTSR
jgi:hypothetical protein